MITLAAFATLLASADLPEHGPLPTSRPQTPQDAEAPDTRNVGSEKSPEEEKAETEPSPTVADEEPQAYIACIASLKARGIVFREIGRIDDGNGCGIARPVAISALQGGVKLEPEGVMRCETARTLDDWVGSTVEPMLERAAPGEKLARVEQASSYICKKRNGAETGKISEHARGNAIDIAGFSFSSGKTFAIAPRMKDSSLEGAFQRAIASAACLYFTTVLDPGSDEAHETHLHLDVMRRKGGYRYCW